MRRTEVRSGTRAAHALVSLALLAGAAFADDRPTRPLRFEAPIRVERAAPFVAIVATPALYARSEQNLADLRIVDAGGDRVPFTLLAPRRAVETRDTERDAALFALPPRPAGATAGSWPSPVDVVVDGDRITVRRRGGAASRATANAVPPAGWLIDTGERRADAPPVRRLRLRWSAPAEFAAAYRLETSTDLRQWRDAGGGQVIALAATAAGGAPLAQPNVALPDGAGRFVRLVWLDPVPAPLLTGATAVAPEQRSVDVDAPVEVRAAAAVDAADPHAGRALVVDLGGALPVDDVVLRFASGNRIAPVVVQGRRTAAEPWRDLGATVFNRFERDGTVSESPPFPIGDTAGSTGAVRHLRLLVDERAGSVRPADVTLVARVRPETIVFASQGTAPWTLHVGSPDAPAGALPPATLVPRLDDERARFGSATLGGLREIPAAARAAELDADAARRRPLLLWGVLLVGVAALGAMVWRLARSPRVPPA